MSASLFRIISNMSDDKPDKDKQKLISVKEAAEIYGFHPDYLARLARNGRLKAQKIGGVWITTQTDVEIFIRSRKHRGAFRDDIELN